MNAERLHAIVRSVSEEVTSASELMTQLAEAARVSANNPGDPDAQRNLIQIRDAAHKRLDQAPSESLSPTGREALKELKVATFVGSGLKKRIDEIFRRNSITPAAAADELERLGNEVKELWSTLVALEQGLDRLGIGVEELKPGEVEVSFLIPRAAVHDGLEALGQEFISLTKIVRPFQEYSTGSYEDVPVTGIASSEFQAYLRLSAAVAANFAKAVETVLDVYEKVLSIRKAKQQLEEAGVDGQITGQLEENAKSITAHEIERFVGALMNNRPDDVDQDRENELRIGLEKATQQLARRIDLGYRVDLNAEQLPPPDDEKESTDRAETRTAVDDVLAARERLKNFKLTGKPILGLPEPTDAGADDASPTPDGSA